MATEVVADDQIPPLVAFAKAVVDPEQSVSVPVMAGTTGNEFTVIVFVTVVVQAFVVTA